MQKGYWDAGFPIYQPTTARAADTRYFKDLNSTQPGVSKAILGHVIADQVANASYMIVRRGYREPRTAQRLQTLSRGSRGYGLGPRTVYNITRTDYVIVRQAWNNGAAVELQVFSTGKEASKALKELTGRRPHSQWTTTPEVKEPNYKLLPPPWEK